MKIGIIGAIKEEIEILKKNIHIYEIKKIQCYKIYIGKFEKNNIFLIKSGIGKVSASISTMILINIYKPDIIINTGSAGALKKSFNIGDVIIPEKTCYYDVDLTNFGYALGQIPKYPEKFKINQDTYEIFKKITKKNILKFKTGLIISGDLFVRGYLLLKKLKNQFSSAVAVEMESAAIAQVCHQFHIPIIVVKSISDLSNEHATLNFKKNIEIASLQSSRFVVKILENINII